MSLLATWEAMNPAAPVMRMFLGLYEVAILKSKTATTTTKTLNHLTNASKYRKRQIQIQSPDLKGHNN